MKVLNTLCGWLRAPAPAPAPPPGQKIKQPRRERCPDLSPARAWAVAPAALWDGWTDQHVEEIDLDAFDDNGEPLCPRYGQRGA